MKNKVRTAKNLIIAFLPLLLLCSSFAVAVEPVRLFSNGQSRAISYGENGGGDIINDAIAAYTRLEIKYRTNGAVYSIRITYETGSEEYPRDAELLGEWEGTEGTIVVTTPVDALYHIAIRYKSGPTPSRIDFTIYKLGVMLQSQRTWAISLAAFSALIIAVAAVVVGQAWWMDKKAVSLPQSDTTPDTAGGNSGENGPVVVSAVDEGPRQS